MKSASRSAGFALDGVFASSCTPLGRLRRALRDPARSQQRLLIGLLTRAASTAWGLEHDFGEVLHSEDQLRAFQERVPLCRYEDIQPYVTRARAGECDVLWPGRTRHFAVSGGTVSSGRLIPVTGPMLGAMTRSSLTPGLQYLSGGGRRGFLGGKVLSIPGGVSEGRDQPGVLVGEVSGLMARAVPALLSRRFQAVPPELMLLEDWDAKLQRIVAHTARSDIRAIVMVPSWAPLLFDALMAHVSSLQKSRPDKVHDVWPRLQVFFSGGVALRSYRPLLERYLGSEFDFIETYSASEGFFAFQERVDAPDLLLHVDSGVFYEFVRLEDLHRDQPRRYTVADVEPGVAYALFVSTCSGLWGYGVKDLVRFTSISPPRILVVGRTEAMLDEYGEALYSDEVEQALATAGRLTGALCLHHHVTYEPTSGSIPRHEWLVEFGVPPDDAGAFAATFDRYLREHNRHYRIRRDPGALGAPILTVLPRGTCSAYLRCARSRVSSQTKLLQLSPTRDVARALLETSMAAANGGEEGKKPCTE